MLAFSAVAPLLLVIRACTAVSYHDYPPENGFFDSVGKDGRLVLVRGWAYETALNGSSSTVEIRINGTMYRRIVANTFRPDIVPGGAPDPMHGFSFDIAETTLRGNARIDIYLVPAGGGALWSLNNSPRQSDGISYGLPVLKGVQGQDDQGLRLRFNTRLS